MLFNTSYKNKEYDKESVLLVGKTFPLLQKIKMGGVGSIRFIIQEFSTLLKSIS